VSARLIKDDEGTQTDISLEELDLFAHKIQVRRRDRPLVGSDVCCARHKPGCSDFLGRENPPAVVAKFGCERGRARRRPAHLEEAAYRNRRQS